MQKKSLTLVHLLILMLVLALTCTTALASSHGDGVDPGPADMELQTAAGKKPAKFPHKQHQESFDCAECHHIKGADGAKTALPEGAKVKKCICAWISLCYTQSEGNRILSLCVQRGSGRTCADFIEKWFWGWQDYPL